MRIHYKLVATDYYIELCNKGLRGRRKAGAFLMYSMDGELGNYHTFRFYADAWNISVSTAHEWIKDFNKELDLFEAARSLKRADHKRFTLEKTEQIEQSKSSKPSTHKARPQRKAETVTEQTEQSKSNEDILIDNNNTRTRKKFAEDFFFVYRINNGKYTGKRNEAIEAYLSVTNANTNQLLLALHAYKASGEQMVGAEKFLKDMIYLDYMKINMRVFISGTWIMGEYDSSEDMFVDDTSKSYTLTPQRMTEKFAKGELEFIGEVAA